MEVFYGERTTFDDAAATLITAGAPPFVGTFRPEEMLAAFNGKAGAAVNGQWKLHVVDDSEVDTGAIQCVSLFLTTTAAPAPGLALATNGTLSGTPTTAGSPAQCWASSVGISIWTTPAW